MKEQIAAMKKTVESLTEFCAKSDAYINTSSQQLEAKQKETQRLQALLAEKQAICAEHSMSQRYCETKILRFQLIASNELNVQIFLCLIFYILVARNAKYISAKVLWQIKMRKLCSLKCPVYSGV